MTSPFKQLRVSEWFLTPFPCLSLSLVFPRLWSLSCPTPPILRGQKGADERRDVNLLMAVITGLEVDFYGAGEWPKTDSVTYVARARVKRELRVWLFTLSYLLSRSLVSMNGSVVLRAWRRRR